MTLPPAFAKRSPARPHQTIRPAHVARCTTQGTADRHAAARMGIVAPRG